MKTTVVSTTKTGVNFEIKYNTSNKYCTLTVFEIKGVLAHTRTQTLRCGSISELYRLVELYRSLE